MSRGTFSLSDPSLLAAAEADPLVWRKILQGLDLVFQGMLNELPSSEEITPPENQQEITEAAKDKLRTLLALQKLEQLQERIIYIYAESPYCQVALAESSGRPPYLRLSIAEVEKHFPSHELLRVHRSYLVNPAQVVQVEKKGVRDFQLTLRTPALERWTLPVGRSYVPKLQSLYPIWFPLAADPTHP